MLAKLLLGCNLGSVAGYSLFCSSPVTWIINYFLSHVTTIFWCYCVKCFVFAELYITITTSVGSAGESISVHLVMFVAHLAMLIYWLLLASGAVDYDTCTCDEVDHASGAVSCLTEPTDFTGSTVLAKLMLVHLAKFVAYLMTTTNWLQPLILLVVLENDISSCSDINCLPDNTIPPFICYFQWWHSDNKKNFFWSAVQLHYTLWDAGRFTEHWQWVSDCLYVGLSGDVKHCTIQSYQPAKYVACIYDDQWYIDNIVEQSHINGNVLVTFMKHSNTKLSWPRQEGNCWIHFQHILCTTDVPQPVSQAAKNMLFPYYIICST